MLFGFRNVSISKKLYFTIGIMAFLIVIELCVLSFAISTLSAIRAYVSGEGLWSKAQKDAVLHLRLYTYSGKETDYKSYLDYLKVPLGDGKARKALEKPVPDIQQARKGLLEGRNHPDDIDGMINLLLRFHNNSYLARTIFYWEKAETSLKKLIPLSNQVHQAVKTGALKPEQTLIFLERIDKINDELTPSEDGFSYTLGEGSRWLEHVILRVLIALALTVEVTGIVIAISVSRSIQKGLDSIIKVVQRLTAGMFDQRVKVYSGDEVGVLATGLNVMADQLEKTILKLQDSEAKLRSFFESSSTCHILLDRELNLIAYNKVADNFARKYYNIELIPGITLSQWVHAERQAEFIANCELAMSGKVVQLEMPVTYANGETLWWMLMYHMAVSEEGELIGVSYHATDITQRVQQEREIKQQNESLARIAYIQSHELRRPVASIMGLSNIFEEEGFTATSEELMLLKKATEELDEKIRMIVGEINYRVYEKLQHNQPTSEDIQLLDLN